ncbi:MAG TPA: TIGR01777 family oxidoreductase [Thermoanaerobaculia bacterium]|nr:TIGR01777 family oxidoreductase [Thermoanaerobaculia bacterium]
MKIVVAGGSGFLGEPIVKRLLTRGGDVAVLTRNPTHVRAGRPVQWDGKSQGAWSGEAAAADVIVNLAGENVGEGRWTDERKKRMVASRLDATHALVEALRRDPSRPRTMINASAVGYYGNRGDELLDESSTRGGGFLAELVERWEAAAREAESLARLVLLRFGVVLDAEGGALKKMALPFKLGAGGPIGNGTQWMSWIDRDDAVRMVEWAIDRESARGIYNATSPQPVRNRDFARALGHALHRPAILPTPAFALRLAFGQMAEEVLIAGQRVVPRRAEEEGFAFERPGLDAALAHELGSD